MSAAVAEMPLTYEEERGKPMPSYNHGYVQMKLGGQFLRDDRFHVLGETTLELAEPPNITPDLCVFQRRRIDLQRDQVRVAEPPLLAVEILSPTQSLDDLISKAHRLLDHGVQSVWVVVPVLGHVTVLDANGRKTYFEGVVTDPATGLQADLANVFS